MVMQRQIQNNKKGLMELTLIAILQINAAVESLLC
jgi:hypothetical protein